MRKIEAIVHIKAKPSVIIEAFLDKDALLQWWGVQRSLIVKEKDGLYVLAWNVSKKGFGYVSSGIIKEYLPDSLLVIENFSYLYPEQPILGPMSLTIKLTVQEKSTQLYLCQDKYGEGAAWDWYYNAVKDAWPVVLETLKIYLENKHHAF